MHGYKVKVFYYAFKRSRKVTMLVYWVDLKIFVFSKNSLFISFYEYFRLMDMICDSEYAYKMVNSGVYC